MLRKAKRFMLLVAVLLLPACGPHPAELADDINNGRTSRIDVEQHCFTLEERERLAKFIVDCSRAANPMSDEEGEDLVYACKNVGEDAVCPWHQHHMLLGRSDTWEFHRELEMVEGPPATSAKPRSDNVPSPREQAGTGAVGPVDAQQP